MTDYRYLYSEIVKNALDNPTSFNLSRLAYWFEDYGSQFWNGECWEIDKEHSLYPVYEEIAPDEYKLIAHEIR